MKNKRGNRVYVGWYTSTDVFGVRGKDNIIAELNSSGNLVQLSIGINERANTYHDQRERRIDSTRLQADESEIYSRDIKVIRLAVLSDTINPSSAQFCSRFEVLINKRGNRMYGGWYTSTDVFGVRGKDNIIAEIDSSGNLVQLSIGDI